MAVITISRQYGSSGAVIAHLISSELGFRLIDRDLVDAVAREARILPEVAHGLDERADDWASGLVQSVLLALRGQPVTPEAYRCLANRLIREAARHENLVILGRAARAVLSLSAGTFHVHVVAPIEDRVAEVCRRERVGPDEARRRIYEVDRGRADYVRAVGHHDWQAAAYYDLVVNTHRVTPADAAALIIEAARRTGAIPLADAPTPLPESEYIHHYRVREPFGEVIPALGR
jgi:cytidylate kinase